MANDIATVAASPAPVVETASGRLRGACEAGIHSFKGVPYGASTGGHNRFMPPQPPLAWSGLHDGLAYGNRAWQLPNRPKRRAVL
jgi:para-nitrobenzyl esterase